MGKRLLLVRKWGVWGRKVDGAVMKSISEMSDRRA